MELTKMYADAMMRAAIAYCDQRQININADHLSQCLKAQKETILGAIKDCKEALDAHMDSVAEMTFRASAAQAGIAAAKMYAIEKN